MNSEYYAQELDPRDQAFREDTTFVLSFLSNKEVHVTYGPYNYQYSIKGFYISLSTGLATIGLCQIEEGLRRMVKKVILPGVQYYLQP